MQTASTTLGQAELSASALKVRGLFRILNFFDIAEAIDLDNLRGLLGPEAAPRSPGFVHLTPEYAQAQTPPLHWAIFQQTFCFREPYWTWFAIPLWQSK